MTLVITVKKRYFKIIADCDYFFKKKTDKPKFNNVHERKKVQLQLVLLGYPIFLYL